METLQKVIKEAVLSSLASEDGKVDSVKMENARDVGFAFEEVQEVVKIAKKHGGAKEIEDFMDSVQIVPKKATQYSFHHIEIIPKERSIETEDERKEDSTHSKDGKKEDEEQISAPHAMANAIESAINSEAGKVDSEALQLAVKSGWTSDEVNHMVRLALNSIHDHAGDKLQVLRDLERLRMLKQQKRPKAESLTTHSWTNNYKPKGGWTMSYKEHRALSKAVLTAIRSPNHAVDPVALEEAIDQGLSRDVVMEAIDSALTNIDSAVKRKRLRLLKEGGEGKK